jgi:hypothetical protein
VSSVTPGYVGTQYLHDGNDRKGELSVTYILQLPEVGKYEVRLSYTQNGNRATNVPVTVKSGDQSFVKKVNQREKPTIDGSFVSLGQFHAAEQITVTINTTGTDGHVIADAAQAVKVP